MTAPTQNGLSDFSLCRGCGEAEENAKHFLCECHVLAWKRISTLGWLLSSQQQDANVADSVVSEWLLG